MLKKPQIKTEEFLSRELDGGINLTDQPQSLFDNELCGGDNVWYKNGMLKSRPRLDLLPVNGEYEYDPFYTTDEPSLCPPDFYYEPTKITRLIGGKKYRMYAAYGNNIPNELRFKLLYKNEMTDFSGICFLNEQPTGQITFEYDGALYCLVTAEDEFGQLNYHAYRYSGSAWNEITSFYVPLIRTGCDMQGGAASREDVLKSGQRCEDKNILSDRYRARYNAESADTSLVFRLLYPVNTDASDTSVTARLTSKSGAVTVHTLVYNGTTVTEATFGADGLKMTVDGDTVQFTDQYGTHLLPEEYKGISDNLEIESSYTNLNRGRVYSMRAAAEISAGKRLMLGASVSDNDCAALIWSAEGNPLYFPEGNIDRIGAATQRVTAFAIQENKLIVFKERETYRLADNLSRNSSRAAVILLCADVGCDIPETVRLCRNRLVWASSNGHVYNLASSNMNSKYNVCEISVPIASELKKFSPESLKKAVACVHSGFYILACNSTVFAFNFESYGYDRVGKVIKYADYKCVLPWSLWHLTDAANGETPHYLSDDGDGIYLRRMEKVRDRSGEHISYFDIPYRLCEAHDYDDGVNYFYDDYGMPCGEYSKPHEISSEFSTKYFDFGDMHRKKLCFVVLAFDKVGKRIEVGYVTDGTYIGPPGETQITEEQGSSQNGIDHITVTLRPDVGHFVRLGLTVRAKGVIQLAGIRALYKSL